MKKIVKRILPLWLLVLLGAGIASGAVLYTYTVITFQVTIKENVGVWAVLENNNFWVPDNGAAHVKYTVTNQSGTSKNLTVISNVNENTAGKLFYSCYRPWPLSTHKVWVDGVNYGFTLPHGQTENLKVSIGDSGPALPNESYTTLQLYLMDNQLV